MLTQERRVDSPVVGICFDCGATVYGGVACVDRAAHSTVELCERCRCIFRQRQVFTGGCCE
jgi:hypothetical protein